VPSIVFGLLGAAVFINYFRLPLSAPLAGGLVLTLMTLPTIIIATRAALKGVPPSLRQAALGLGASKTQMVFHHVLPVTFPSILTATIIGVAQALGETAPLLLIGMNAFVASDPRRPRSTRPRRCPFRSICGRATKTATSSKRAPRLQSSSCFR
jgi:phosphate transport system permease protein